VRDFESSFVELQKEVHRVAKDKGWYDEPRDPMASLMLVVTELAEAAEQLRVDAKPIYREGTKYEGVAVELADAVIRIMDLCQWMHYPLATAILMKHDYNKTRPHRHGGKKY
jgi:NTP pyrophosphatase (non-canonical NTP hydrolase)